MQRLLIVSNRLPINVSRGDDLEKWKFKVSSGGLVSALAGVQKSAKFVWIGWPGIDVEESERGSFSQTLLQEHSSLPVFIDHATSDLHYNGFSNGTIWPLFHYLPGDIKIREEEWQGYKRANQIFADYIVNIAQDGDIVWVHDYHLMLLPEMLRKLAASVGKRIKIGFFLHIPFPTSEVYRVLPYRKEVLEGILNSDLIGFHTYDYARHFLTSCTRILGANTSPTSVDFNNRTIKVGAYPVGVEPEKFEECLKQEGTILKIKNLEDKYKGLKVIVGVERLDYIKGLTQKLLAFEEFLEENTEFIGKVVLIQIAIPSRTEVAEYQKLQNQVFELIGRINGKFSSLNYSPVQFIYNSVNFTELVALYRLADICLVTSTRDGMNLVACEYIASQAGKNGVLILSEFAGCAQSLNGAILINPWNLIEIKKALKTALTLTENQKLSDHSHLLSYVKKFTSSHWGRTFVADLLVSDNSGQDICFDSFKFSAETKNNLFVAENQKLLQDAMLKLSGTAIELNNFCILSPESKDFIYGISDRINLFADHGIWIRTKPGWKKLSLTQNEITNWIDQLSNILKYYSSRVPMSKIEISEELLRWKYENSDRNFSEWISSELQMNLEKFIGHLPLKVQRAENELRIMHSGTDLVKIGVNAVKSLLSNANYDEVVFISKNSIEIKKIAANLLNEKIVHISVLEL